MGFWAGKKPAMKNIAVRGSMKKLLLAFLLLSVSAEAGALFLVFHGDPNLTAASVKHSSLQIYYFPLL